MSAGKFPAPAKLKRVADLLALEAAGKIESLETIESARSRIIKLDMARHEL